ncbi:MAG: leucine-rich repeat domain-containing protein, partial [Candidatus Heimdallarchaeota archaeon]|nr:leucine-rich repeat domain-containing protein [Candidatus Heimdallarchaeota archaeon]
VPEALESISELTQLQILRLIGCELTELPSEILNLKNLIVLDLSNNLFDKLPESCLELDSLTELNLDMNRISSIKIEKEIPRLKKLMLSKNNIYSIDSSISNLSNIEEIYLDSNILAKLPESLIQLKQLKTISLLINHIQELPPELSELSDKVLFDPPNTELVSIKKYLSGLGPFIKMYNIEDEYYLNGPSEASFVEFKNGHVYRIHLKSVDFQYIESNFIKHFKFLTEVRFTSVENIQHLPIDMFEGLHELQIIQFGSFIPSPPKSDSFNLDNVNEFFKNHTPEYKNVINLLQSGIFSGLTKLKTLILNGLFIHQIDNDVFDELSNLEYLDLSYFMAENLPIGVFDKLQSLKKLVMINTQLERLNKGIFDNNHKLTEVYLWGTHMSSYHRDMFVKNINLEVVYFDLWLKDKTESIFIDYIPFKGFIPIQTFFNYYVKISKSGKMTILELIRSKKGNNFKDEVLNPFILTTPVFDDIYSRFDKMEVFEYFRFNDILEYKYHLYEDNYIKFRDNYDSNNNYHKNQEISHSRFGYKFLTTDELEAKLTLIDEDQLGQLLEEDLHKRTTLKDKIKASPQVIPYSIFYSLLPEIDDEDCIMDLIKSGKMSNHEYMVYLFMYINDKKSVSKLLKYKDFFMKYPNTLRIKAAMNGLTDYLLAKEDELSLRIAIPYITNKERLIELISTGFDFDIILCQLYKISKMDELEHTKPSDDLLLNQLSELGRQRINNSLFVNKLTISNDRKLLDLKIQIIDNLDFNPLVYQQLNSLTIRLKERVKLSDSIRELTKLKELKLESYSKNINEVIFSMVNLEKLIIEYDYIEIIPDTIGKLTNLTHLELKVNKISELPNIFNKLSNLKVLIIKNSHVVELPSTLFQLTELEELYIEGSMEFIPDGIGKLTKLVCLSIITSRPCSIPDIFINLINLTKLEIQTNRIQSFPPSFFKLHNLQYLKLTNSYIIEIPEEISNLSNLKHLDLEKNILTEIPISIDNLSNLEYLNLSRNRITQIPETINKLCNLKYLNLEENKIQMIPVSIGDLVNLTNLILNNNEIKVLPEIIGNLIHLEEFLMSDNLLNFLPDEIGSLINLKKLILNYNRIIMFPETISELINLQELHAKNNRINLFPIFHPRQTKLSIINLSYNRLGSVSDNISEITNLSQIYLGSNSFNKIPESLTKLPNLKSLSMRHNLIAKLPKSLFKMKSLTSLDISGNKINEIPSSINNLANLVYLYLENTAISSIEIPKLYNIKSLDLSNNSFFKFPMSVYYLIKLTHLNLGINYISSIKPEVYTLMERIDVNFHKNPVSSNYY